MSDDLLLFPEFPPKPKRKKAAPTELRMRPVHTSLLVVLRAHGPQSDSQLFDRVVGEYRREMVVKAIEELAKAGYARDTGERGQWTKKGREIVWEFVNLPRRSA